MASLRDLLRRKPATNARPIGDSGRHIVDGFLEYDETNVELVGQSGLRIYDRMYRTDPDAHRAIRMGINPILAGDWTVEPYGGDKATDEDRKIAADTAWALGIGPDASSSLLRPRWPDHLQQVLPLLVRSGFTPAEVTWAAATREGRRLLVPSRLGVRLPRTIYRWYTDDDDDLTAIQQFRARLGTYVEIPRQDLLYYRVGAEGDNWEGLSMLRPAYKPWKFKDAIERLDAIAQEREAVGLPVVFPPTATALTPDVLDDLETKLELLRAGELGYLIMPGPDAQNSQEGQGWTFRIEGLAGAEGGRDPHQSLHYYRDAIAAAFIEEFMRLAQGKGAAGARALGDVQEGPFDAACRALADVPRQEANDSLIARFVALNYGPDVAPPTLQISLSSDDLVQLAQYVAPLVSGGALNVDDDLEDHLREIANLPPADPAEREARKAQAAAEADRTQQAHDREMNAPQGQERTVTIKRPGERGTERTTERTRALDAAGPCPEGVAGCDGLCVPVGG